MFFGLCAMALVSQKPEEAEAPPGPDPAVIEVTEQVTPPSAPALPAPTEQPEAAEWPLIPMPLEVAPLRAARADLSVPQHGYPYRLVVAALNVRLRQAPNVAGGYHRVMAGGEQGVELSRSGNWVEMLFPDLPAPNRGWIWADYLAVAPPP